MSAEEIKIVEEKVALVVNDHINYPELNQRYQDWSNEYEQDMLTWGYRSPYVATLKISALLGDKKDSRILDVCAGTGMTGKAMYDAGYTNIEAFDGAPKMLEMAKLKKVYKDYHVGYLGKTMELSDNSYDMVSLFGALCDGHVNPDCFSCFREFCRIVKPGGYFIGGIVIGCLKDPYKKKIDDYMEEMVKDGLWELIENKIHNEDGYEEQIWSFRVK